MIWRVLCSLCILLVLAAPGPASAAPVDDFIKAEMRKLDIPGLSVAVIKDRKIVKLAGYGYSNLETGTPATPDTVYKIASLSKPFIASAILLLAEDNKLQLDDPITKYLEEPPASWKAITIRQVLNHTSGIPRDPIDYHPYQEQKPTAVIKAASTMPLLFEPGEKFLYSNVGYYILAEIIEKASGTPWEEFVSSRIFEPAGLLETSPLTNAIVRNRASGYDQADGKLINAENWIAKRPSAAFLSTVRDLAKWDIYLDAQRPLKPSSWAAMRTVPKLKDGRTSEYGLGWYVESYLGHARIHHDGQYPGFRSTWERFEDYGLSVIVLTNAGRPRVDAMALKIAGYYDKALQAPSFTTSVDVPAVATSGTPAEMRFSLRPDKASPKTVVEMEIWDADNKPVNKQSRSGLDFAGGETRVLDFTWTPPSPGRYWISLGVFGPKFAPNYTWSEHLGQLNAK